MKLVGCKNDKPLQKSLFFSAEGDWDDCIGAATDSF